MLRIFLILLMFFLPLFSYAEDFSSVKIDLPPNVSNNAVQKEQKASFFSKLFNKKSSAQKFVPTDELKGYQGKLPNIESEFQYKNKKTSTVKDKGKNAEEYSPEEFEPSNTDDPLFLDVILNKGKPSKYIEDMVKVMKFLESFRLVILTHESLQKFNANVNMLDLYTKRIEKLYANAPEGMSPSYWGLIDLNYKAKVLGNLKFDANYYSKFSPTEGTAYDPSNLKKEDEKLLLDLDKTIFEIRQLNN